SFKVANLLVDLDVEGVKKGKKKLRDQASLDQRGEQSMESTENKWKALTTTISSFWSVAIQPALDVLKPLIDQLNVLIDGPLKKWVDENKELFKWLGLIAIGIGGLLAVLGTIGIALAGLATFAGIAAGGLAVLLGPLGWIIAGIAALCAAVYLIYRYWGPISDWFKNLWDNIITNLSGVWQNFKNCGAKLIVNLWEGIKSKGAWLMDKMKTIATGVMNFWPQSPAKEGPLRNLSRVNILGEVAKTLNPAPLLKAMSGVAAASMLVLAPMGASTAMAMPSLAPAYASLAAHGGSGSGGVTVHYAPQITISGQAGPGAREDLMAALRAHQDELVAIIERNQARNGRKVY
ncbi:MAG: hypothetical protein HQK82_10060, partial [Desulfovibrionaceae bacterium]|nr:hypothetical protein [Desulfovibrionaceae bacterium]